MKKTIVLGLLAIVLIAGCIGMFLQVEIDTGQVDCRDKIAAGAMLFGELIDSICIPMCQRDGYTYKQWKCSEQDTLACVCNR